MLIGLHIGVNALHFRANLYESGVPSHIGHLGSYEAMGPALR